MRNFFTAFFVAAVFCSSALAEIATTPDGRVFELRPDGSYVKLEGISDQEVPYESIHIVDLHLRLEEYVGKKVRVQGALSVSLAGAGVFNLLQRPDSTGVALWAYTERTPRSEIADVLKKCKMICNKVELTGVIGQAPTGMSIIVDHIKLIDASSPFYR